MSNVSSAIWLHPFHHQQTTNVREEKTAVDQFALAAFDKPRCFRTKLQKPVYDALQARKDVEEAKRTKWIQIRGPFSRTPRRRCVKFSPTGRKNIQMLGTGKRALTLGNTSESNTFEHRVARTRLASRRYWTPPPPISHLHVVVQQRWEDTGNERDNMNTHKRKGNTSKQRVSWERQKRRGEQVKKKELQK